MKPTISRLAMTAALATSSWLFADDKPAPHPTRPAIQVCFVLDTTGSMGGLIDGAKAKIWSIANEIIRTEPRPQVSIALVAYRDRGDQYITKLVDLTDDIDVVWKNLQDLRADGGGDSPESVNQALHEAVTRINWNASRDVTKIIFLVGDAPPHMDYQDDAKYPQVCQEAMARDLIINTVQCGSMTQTTPIWQEISRLAEGSYVALGQTGDMAVINSPFDEELAKLNVRLNATVVAYGAAPQQALVREKLVRSTDAPAAASADRAAYNLAVGKAIQGRGDLLDDLRDKDVNLADLRPEDLPPELQKMSPEQLQAHLDAQAAARAEVQQQLAAVSRKRQDYIEAEKQRLAKESGSKDSFDAKVSEIIKEQAARER